MAPLMFLGLVFGLVAGFVMGWVCGRVYGRHEGRADARRERYAAVSREPAPVLAAPQVPQAGPVVLVVQNQSTGPATPPPPPPLTGDYSHHLAEIVGHLAAEQSRRMPTEPAAITTRHIVDARHAGLDGERA